MNTYPVGAPVKLSVTFTDQAGAAADPGTVTLKVQTPAGIETLYTYLTDAGLIKTATGAYYLVYTATAPGAYFYQWVGTGSSNFAAEGVFQVRKTEF